LAFYNLGKHEEALSVYDEALTIESKVADF
jgi:tetratricopeptide (TPR) repeat protein